MEAAAFPMERTIRNLCCISVKKGGSSILRRDLYTVPNSLSRILAKHSSPRSTQTCSHTVKIFHLAKRETFNENKISTLSESVTSAVLHKLSFSNQTRSFLTLPTITVLSESTFDARVAKRCRHRYTKRDDASKENVEETDLEDDDNEEEEDESDDLSGQTYPEDMGFPSNYKEVKVHLKSLRLDAVVSAGLNIARNKVDDYFLESKLKLNGDRVLKKSKQMKIGDFVDLVMSVEDGKSRVKRVRVLKMDKERTSNDKLKVTVRAWRSAVPIDNAGS